MRVEKLQSMWKQAFPTILMVLLVSVASNGALCPTVCRCEEEALRTTCANASLEFVPIQLNPEVKVIDLFNNKITNVHYAFSFYEKLVHLDLSCNKIRLLGSNNFETQKVLKHLNLSSNELEELSKDSLKGLKALTVLDLSFNRLEELNSIAFRELHSLTVLKLSANRLGHLEGGLFQATKHLQDLFLEDNQFLMVPTSALADLSSSLHHLSISRNLIRSVGEGDMSHLHQLRTLKLSGNLIADLHENSFLELIALDYLDLSNNNLTTMPINTISKVTNLTTIRLSGNFITNLQPLAFKGLSQLRFVKLDRLDYLTFVDNRAFNDNINLEKVWMDHNIRLKKLPTRLFHSNRKLKFVSIRYSAMEMFEASHFPIDQLHELKLGGNSLQCNCSLGWLWHLIQQSRLGKVPNSTDVPSDDFVVAPTDLTLDVDEIRCAGPEHMKEMLLYEASKSQMDCSVGWLAAASVVVTVAFILAVIGGVIYWAPARKARASKKEIRSTSLPESSVISGIGAVSPYEVTRIEKYTIPSQMMHNDYRALPPWDPYNNGAPHCQSTLNIYESLEEAESSIRPQIVYV